MNDREILIDLGPAPQGPAPAADEPPRTVVRRWWRIVAIALAGVLALSTGGAAPFPPPPLRLVHVTPLDSVTYHHLIGDVLVSVTPAATPDQPDRRLTGFDLTSGRELWSWVVTPDRTVAPDQMGVGTTVAGGTLLVTSEPGRDREMRTTAVDARTGQRRWSVPYHLQELPGERFALAFDQIFRPESRITDNHVGSEQELYIAPDGSAYTEPPIGVIVRVIDLEAGTLRWETPRLTNAVVVPAGGGQPTLLLTIAGDGRVEVREAATGALRHRLDWPGGDPFEAERVGDVVVVSRSGSDPGVVVYPATLQRPLWTRSLSGPNPFLTGCGPVLCWPDTDTGTTAFDPATGRMLWRLPEQAQLLSAGSRLVRLDGGWQFGRVIDAWTGHEVGDLTGWRMADHDPMMRRGQLRADVPPLVLRLNAATQHTELGLLNPAEASVRPLGVVPHVLDTCEVARRFLACHDADGQLRIWRYELPRSVGR